MCPPLYPLGAQLYCELVWTANGAHSVPVRVVIHRFPLPVVVPFLDVGTRHVITACSAIRSAASERIDNIWTRSLGRLFVSLASDQDRYQQTSPSGFRY